MSGEQQESDGFLDSPSYVLDAMTLGIPKGWIMLGHAVSEEQGMLEMAQWIKTVHYRRSRFNLSGPKSRSGRRSDFGSLYDDKSC